MHSQPSSKLGTLSDTVGTSKCWRACSVFIFLFSSHLFNILWEFLFNIYYSTIRYIQNWKFLHVTGGTPCFAAPQHCSGISMSFLLEEKSDAAKEITGLKSSYAVIPNFHARFCFSDCSGWNCQTSAYSISALYFPGALSCWLFLTPHETDYPQLKTQLQKYAGYFIAPVQQEAFLWEYPWGLFVQVSVSVIWFTYMFRWYF